MTSTRKQEIVNEYDAARANLATIANTHGKGSKQYEKAAEKVHALRVTVETIASIPTR